MRATFCVSFLLALVLSNSFADEPAETPDDSTSAAVLPATNAIAAASQFTPARFVNGDHSLQNIIEFPSIDDDGLTVVYCVVHVLKSGRVRMHYCFASATASRPFNKAIRSAVKKAKTTPAIVDGEAHAVYFYYRVVFLKEEGDMTVGVYSNWGNDVVRYGTNYEAPQRYTDFPYPEACNNLQGSATMVVDSDGTIKGEVEFEPDMSRYHRLCTGKMRSVYENAKYIPGHSRGKPVEATYVEAWGKRGYLRVD